MSTSVSKEKCMPDKITIPSQSYTRNEFYDTEENIRYYINFNLMNGQQAKDIPIEIQDLIEFIGDVEILIENKFNMNINNQSHTHWFVKLNYEEKHVVISENESIREQKVYNFLRNYSIE